MDRLGKLIQRAYSSGWCTTAALAVVLLAVSAVVDARFNGALELRSPPWSLLVVFAGVLVLNPRQEALLAVMFFLVELNYDQRHRQESWDAATQSLFLRRFLILGVCIWAARVRTRLEQQRARLEANRQELSNRLLQSLQASAMAHEMRQPLSQLLMQSRLLQHRVEQSSALAPPLEEALHGLAASAEQLNTLVGAIGQLLKAGPMEPQTVDLAAVVKGCVHEITPRLHTEEVELRCSGLERPLLITGQAPQLAIACTNLLNNATEALRPQGAPRRLVVRLEHKADQITLVVGDNGPGLPSTNLRDLLMRSTKPGGMGVGLLTVQSIAQRHGGTLLLGQSAELGGAELQLNLPARSSHPSETPDTRRPTAPAPHRSPPAWPPRFFGKTPPWMG